MSDKLRKDYFPQHLSKHLIKLLNNLSEKYGEESPEYKSVANQYIYNELEDSDFGNEVNLKHYEAGDTDAAPSNIERLYKHHCCIEITFSCAANCRYCLRSNYDRTNLTEEEMVKMAEYLRDINASEILITGGDSMCAPKKLSLLADKILDIAPNVKIFRIATRLITQQPDLINDRILQILSSIKQRGARVEVATQINSAYEFDEDTDKAIDKIQKLGITIYSQNVFLHNVNDTPEQLIKLYESMRLRGIEAHYLFNSIPMVGTHHHRPSISKFIDCYEALVNSGQVTGRSKPILALMTPIGKITLTPKNVIEYVEKSHIKLRSNYKYEDRISYNPGWTLPSEAWVDENGYLCITYLDGEY